jgi:hypothetical protein
MEHYCTLFDQGFLPQGLALHASLRRHAAPFTLWVLCLDSTTRRALESLKLPDVRLLLLEDCETVELRAARANRSYGEYCWTLASHLFSFVFDRDSAVSRLTYLDADVFFFGPPSAFLAELEASGKRVLITEHAFAPAFAHYAATAGRFCVQFVTFTREAEAMSLLARWQRQTRERCESVTAGGVFGDQQYLDEWPTRFGHLVHVLDHRYRTLAPWNADHGLAAGEPKNVVLYHFHTFRIVSPRWSLWCHGYPLRNAATLRLYAAYQHEVHAALRLLRSGGADLALRPFRPGIGGWLRLLRSWLRGRLLLRRHPTVLGA